ncbi:carboxypeptidase regulatory-like domain-containing protein, partial [Patescibacteria group bacterium]|nr:carboxypeptidase regulatory-like domain-containing protein [Patescibacteria group bacterium]
PSLTTLYLERSLNNSGNLLPSGLDIVFDGPGDDGDDSEVTCGNVVFDSITVDKQSNYAHIRYNSDCTTTGNYILTRAYIINPSNPATLYIGGNLTINSNNNYSSPNVIYRLNGTGDQIVTKYRTSSIDNNIVINKSSGSARLVTGFDTSGSCSLSAGTLDINTFDLTCTSGLGVSTGSTFRLAGNENPTAPTIGTNSTVEYSGNGDGLVDTYTLKSWSYENLVVNANDGNSEVFNFPATLTLPYDFSCLAGTCTAPSGTFTVAGNWTVAGNYDNNSGNVVLNGSNQEISGFTTFNNFSKVVTTLDTLTLPGSAIESQVFVGTMELRGALGQLLRLRSSIDGIQWHIDPQGTRTIEYLDTKDSYNDNALVILVTGFNIINSGNNYNWEFNAEPQTSNLGPTAYVQGDYISDTTPTITFTVTDPNGGDTVQYQIQIDNNADFLTPVIDYESVLGAQGAKSFTVGQAEGGGSYTIGNEGQSLGDDDYYFRIRGIDDEGSAGAYALANAGLVAFRLDFSEPGLVQNLDSTTHTVAQWDVDTQITATWSIPVETGSGIAGYSYIFDTTSNTVPDASADLGVVTQVTSNALASGSSYYFHICAVDAQGNWGDAAHLGPFYIDVTNPAGPTNLAFAGGYELPWVGATDVTVTWTAGTDSHSGVTGYSYVFDTSAGTDPDTIPELGVVTQETLSGLVIGNNYYLHIRPRDSMNNWGGTVHFGPFALDSQEPTVPGAPDAVTPEDETQPVVSWLASSDVDSGIDHYEIQVSKDDTFFEGVFSVEVDTNSYEFSNDLASGTWYARVRSYDLVGNASAFSDLGSFEISAITVVVPDEDDDDATQTTPGETATVYIYVSQEAGELQEIPETGEDDSADEAGTVFIVTVRDSSGNSLSNMNITLVDTDGTETVVQTDENGVAAFQGVVAGSYTVVYQKNGTKYSKDITLEEVEGDDEYTSLEVKFEESDIVERAPESEKSPWKTVTTVVLILLGVGVVIIVLSIFVFNKKQ